MKGSTLNRAIDVLIIGAGPSGAALAMALKRAGVPNVLMIDRPLRRPFQIGESAAPGLGSLLRKLGLDARLETRGHLLCHGNLSAWSSPQPRIEDFMLRPGGPGWHLDRAAFDSWLRAEAVSMGAELCAPAHLVAAHRSGETWRIEIETPAETLRLESRRIIDASGRPAAFARRQGARLHHHDRLLAHAVMGRSKPARDYSGFSIIEACEIGWWYGAHLPAGKCLIALMTDRDIAEEANLTAPSSFWQQWAATSLIRRHCEPLERTAAPVIFSANSQRLDRASGPGWLAIGDALMALDPLSASGLTGGLEDAIAAAEVITSSSSAEALARYQLRADATFKRYMAERNAIHAMERRWPASPFWQRRIQAFPQNFSSPGTETLLPASNGKDGRSPQQCRALARS